MDADRLCSILIAEQEREVGLAVSVSLCELFIRMISPKNFSVVFLHVHILHGGARVLFEEARYKVVVRCGYRCERAQRQEKSRYHI